MNRFSLLAVLLVALLATSCSNNKKTATTETKEMKAARAVSKTAAAQELERVNSIVGLTDDQKVLFAELINDIAMKQQQVKGSPNEATQLQDLENVKLQFYFSHFTGEQMTKYKNTLKR